MTSRLTILTIIATLHCLTASAQIDSILNSIAANNLTLQALRHEHSAIVLDIRSENTLSGPSIEYSPFFARKYKGVAESELIVSEEFDFPTLYAQRRRQAKLQGEANESEYLAVENSILREAQLLYLDIIRQNQFSDMHRQRLAQSESMLALFEKRMDAGDANILELNKVKLEKMEAQKAAVEAENTRTQLLQRLQSLNGGKPLDVTEREFPASAVITDVEAMVRSCLASNPQLHAAQANTRISDHQLSMSRQSWLPSISVGYRRNTEEKSHTDGFLVGASFPLFSTSSKVKAARQRQLAAQLQLDDLTQQKESELRSLGTELMRLRQVLDHSDTELLRQTLTLLDKALAQGQITALQYYTETNDIYSKLQTHIDTHAEYCKKCVTIGVAFPGVSR